MTFLEKLFPQPRRWKVALGLLAVITTGFVLLVIDLLRAMDKFQDQPEYYVYSVIGLIMCMFFDIALVGLFHMMFSDLDLDQADQDDGFDPYLFEEFGIDTTVMDVAVEAEPEAQRIAA